MEGGIIGVRRRVYVTAPMNVNIPEEEVDEIVKNMMEDAGRNVFLVGGRSKMKDVGLLLLGIGTFLIALVVAHWYFFEFLPRMGKEPLLMSWCSVDGGKAVVSISVRETVEKVKVNVGGETCEFEVMRAGTSNVCVADVNDTTTYTINYVWKGRKYSESGVCRVIEHAYPVVD